MLGISKNLGITTEAALYDISYANAMMYCSATPTLGDTEADSGDTDIPDFDPRLDANNPDNFNDKDETYV